MNILLFGGAGFIGTNLVKILAKNPQNQITVVDACSDFFKPIKHFSYDNVSFIESEFEMETDFDSLLENQDIVYHLVSTTVPSTSNQAISQELIANVVVSSMMLESCVRKGVKKVIFISSGGTVYGKGLSCPLSEDCPTNPISSYGVQKITIEKLLYLYQTMYGLDYRIIRLANPYGPYQRPNGILGAVTTFTYKALKNDEIKVYGDGTVVRDFIYIDDAVDAILKIAQSDCKYKVYNLGSGYGTSINQILDSIKSALDLDLNITYKPGRAVDVPVNYLDISRYEDEFGPLCPMSLSDGIQKTAEFLKKMYL